MKNISFLTILFLFCFAGCKTMRQTGRINPDLTQSGTAKEQGVNFSEQSTWLLGYFDPARLAAPPYSEWYLKGFDEYQPKQEVIDELSALNKDDLTITVVMGTWCPDSRREVPRFMRILDMCKFPPDKVTFIGVDNTKLSPIGDYDKLNIERVPTFIFLKNKIEIGRIIENPKTSLEQDMINILTGNEN